MFSTFCGTLTVIVGVAVRFLDPDWPELCDRESGGGAVIRIRSGLAEGAPRALACSPMLHLGSLAGVLELGLFQAWSEVQLGLELSELSP
jgi:hypothetical protein